MTTFLTSVVRSVKIGALIGVMLCALASIAYLIGGRATFDGLHTTFLRVVIIDLFSGVLVGAIVGLARPIAVTRLGAGILGFVCGLIVGVLIRIGREGLGTWSTEDLVTIIIFAATLGVPVGLSYREIFAPSKRHSKNHS